MASVELEAPRRRSWPGWVLAVFAVLVITLLTTVAASGVGDSADITPAIMADIRPQWIGLWIVYPLALVFGSAGVRTAPDVAGPRRSGCHCVVGGVHPGQRSTEPEPQWLQRGPAGFLGPLSRGPGVQYRLLLASGATSPTFWCSTQPREVGCFRRWPTSSVRANRRAQVRLEPRHPSACATVPN